MLTPLLNHGSGVALAKLGAKIQPLKRKRASRAAYFRTYRARKKAAATKPPVPVPLAFSVRKGSEASAIVRWSRECLSVPPGHPLEGSPMVVPAFMETIYEDLFTPGVTEILLCIARKKRQERCGCRPASGALNRPDSPGRVSGGRGKYHEAQSGRVEDSNV